MKRHRSCKLPPPTGPIFTFVTPHPDFPIRTPVASPLCHVWNKAFIRCDQSNTTLDLLSVMFVRSDLHQQNFDFGDKKGPKAPKKQNRFKKPKHHADGQNTRRRSNDDQFAPLILAFRLFRQNFRHLPGQNTLRRWSFRVKSFFLQIRFRCLSVLFFNKFLQVFPGLFFNKNPFRFWHRRRGVGVGGVVVGIAVG